MTSNRKILAAFALQLALGTGLVIVCVRYYAVPRAPNILPAVVQSAIGRANDVRLYSLDPFKKFSSEQERISNGFHGFFVLGVARPGIVERFLLNAAASWGLAAKNPLGHLCFNPRHAIRYAVDGKNYDLLICFECGEIEAYEGDQRVAALLTGPYPQLIFNSLLSLHSLPIVGNTLDH